MHDLRCIFVYKNETRLYFAYKHDRFEKRSRDFSVIIKGDRRKIPV